MIFTDFTPFTDAARLDLSERFQKCLMIVVEGNLQARRQGSLSLVFFNTEVDLLSNNSKGTEMGRTAKMKTTRDLRRLQEKTAAREAK